MTNNGADDISRVVQDKTVRLFFALEPDPPCCDSIQYVLRTNQPVLSRCGKITDRDNLHLTLRFLGDRPNGQIKELETVLANVAAIQPPFLFYLDHFGLFGPEQAGSKRTARKQVLWLGSDQNEPIGHLADLLDQALVQKSLLAPDLLRPASGDRQCEYLPFRAHLTLTRQVPRDETGNLLQQLQSFSPIPFQVRFISLMQSVRIQDRLRYLPISRALLIGQ